MKLIRGINVNTSVILLLTAVASCWAELRLLLSVFRHGDRYPIAYSVTKNIYPLNPLANVSWFPDTDGGLTIEGKGRSFRLGKIMRERYEKFLGPIYSQSLFEFRSSPIDRCIVSSLLVAAGIFPPSDGQRWNQRLNWQPIPVLPVSRKNDILYFGMLCSKYQAILQDIRLKDPAIIKYNRGMQQFYNYVSRNTGAPVTNLIVYGLYIELLATISSGNKVPKWAEGTFMEELFRDAAIQEYMFLSWTDELKQYTGGVWLKKWLENVQTYLALDDANNSIKKKAYFYCGHDINIAGILTTLGIFYRHVPNYSSAINFELHEDSDQHFYVKVLHKDSDEFVEQLIPGCGSILCPLETFKNIFAKVIPKNWTMECGTLGNVETLIATKI